MIFLFWVRICFVWILMSFYNFYIQESWLFLAKMSSEVIHGLSTAWKYLNGFFCLDKLVHVLGYHVRDLLIFSHVSLLTCDIQNINIRGHFRRTKPGGKTFSVGYGMLKYFSKCTSVHGLENVHYMNVIKGYFYWNVVGDNITDALWVAS